MQVNIDCTVFLKYYTQSRFLTPGKCELQNPVLESAETVKASRHQFLELFRPWSSIKSSSYSKLSSALPPILMNSALRNWCKGHWSRIFRRKMNNSKLIRSSVGLLGSRLNYLLHFQLDMTHFQTAQLLSKMTEAQWSLSSSAEGHRTDGPFKETISAPQERRDERFPGNI